MTINEARKVAEICSEAGEECRYGLAAALSAEFPEFKWTFEFRRRDSITVALRGPA